MPIKTNLSSSPYFDDYDQSKNFAKILFQPGVAVQTRELNQLQTLMQKQFERIGDNLYKRGTILDGVNFSFFNKYDFVKILDNTLTDGPAVPTAYVGLFAKKESGNLSAYIMNSANGFETGDPKLKTIFVNYRNSSNTFQANSFLATDILTIHSEDSRIFKVNIDNGGISFSNSDLVVFVAAVSVNVTTGTFTNGEFLFQPSTGANVEIIGVGADPDTDGNVLLNIKPRQLDLTNAAGNSAIWTIDLLASVQNDGATVTGVVETIWGNGATGIAKTSGTGKVTEVTVTNGGTGYEIVPHATIKSDNNTTGLSALDMTARNYLTKITVASVANPVGNGYAFGVSEGVIYQKGYYLRVEPQIVIVNNYSSSPNNVVVGFDTKEEIITADIDTSLLDNALGTENHTAPGADRLKMTPLLVVNTTANARANDEFFIIAEWNDGNPFKQTQVTTFDNVGDEMATRMFDTAGDFVLDTFLVTTDAIANTELEGTKFTVVVDPGTAYIRGYRSHTNRNFRVDVKKGTDTELAVNQRVSLNYDNYVRINEVGGLFQFSTGDVIKLQDTAKTFLTDVSLILARDTTAAGTEIGDARIRSMTLESGIPGDPAAIYRLYLFDLSMDSGKNFRDVRSIHYPGTNEGVADTFLELDPTTNTNIAIIRGQRNNTLIFRSGAESVKNSNATNYIYRTIDQTTNFGNSGILTKDISSATDEFFPYGFGQTLSDSQMLELIVVPIANDLIQFVSLTGTVSVNTTIANIVGTATTFLTDFDDGDYCYLDDEIGGTQIKKLTQIVNNTFMIADSNCSFTDTTALIRRAFPQHVPIPFGTRSGLTANLDVTGDILTLDLGLTIAGTVSVNTAVGVNIERFDTTSTAKTANRDQLVKLRLANNVGGVAGPWCLGVPDVFRLKNVYLKAASDVDTDDPNLVQDFYIEHNQNANFYDLSYLHIRNTSDLTLTSADYLLCEFDYTTTSGVGYFDTVSYLNTANAEQIANIDSTALGSLTSSLASWEIPEVYTHDDEYYDLISSFDFRPLVANTVLPTTSPGSAPLNPDILLGFGDTSNPLNDLKFPLPDSIFRSDIEEYKGRIDCVIMGKDGHVAVLKGTASVDPQEREYANVPTDAMKLQLIEVPPYPNLARNLNDQLAELVSTRMVNELVTTSRLARHLLNPVFDSNLAEISGQPLGYTMGQIGALERRIEHLEYYTSLSILETSITNRVIPSSVDGTLNRFKFGFFADDYSTWINLATRDPQFNADIEVFADSIIVGENKIPKLATNLLVPPKYAWIVKHHLAQLAAPFIDVAIVNQDNCTERPPLCDLELIEIQTGSELVANAILYDWVHLNQQVVNFYDEVKMGTISGPCKFYFHSFYDPLVEIFRKPVGSEPTDLIASTLDAVAMTDDDVQFLRTNAYTEDFFRIAANGTFWRRAVPLGKKFFKNANGYIIYSATLSFDHDASGGQDYVIRTSTENFQLGIGQNGCIIQEANYFQYMLVYPVNRGILETFVFDPCLQTVPTVFSGTMSITDGGTTVTSALADKVLQLSRAILNYDRIEIVVRGLRPLTEHRFYVDGVENTSSIRQEGGALGEAIITNESGVAVFTFYLNQAWYNKVDDVLSALPNWVDSGKGTRKIVSSVSGGISRYTSGGGRTNDDNNAYDEIQVDVAYALFEVKSVASSAVTLQPLVVPNSVL